MVMRAVAQARPERTFHGCHACGKCCNSPPQASLPELFHHERRFLGCLSLQRVRRLRKGDLLEGGLRALGDDARETNELAARLFHATNGVDTHDVFLFTRAFESNAAGDCPARDDDGTCLVHDDRKPTVCRVVPFDAALPNRLQGVVLAARRHQSRDWGSDCLSDRPTTGLRLVTERLRVVDEDALEALDTRRRQLAEERTFWGDEVARLLGPDLLDHPERVARLPENGTFVLSIVPVLSVIAVTSPLCEARVLDYVRAQARLYDAVLGAPSAPRDAEQLRRLARAHRAFGHALESGAFASSHEAGASPRARAVENWLGLR